MTACLHVLWSFVWENGGNVKLYCDSGIGQLLIMSASAKHNMDISITLFVGFGGLEKGRLL